MNELKPCPFCGGEAAIFQGSDENQHTVRCVQCAIKMPIMLNREGAIEAWNHRAEQDAAPVVHGRWIAEKDAFNRTIFKCSICGNHDNKATAIHGRYCWFCGAKMDVKEATI